MMSLRESVLNRESYYSPNPLGGFDPLARERSKVLEPVRRQLHNETPPITRYSYSETACTKHHDPFVSKILRALRKTGLQGYRLHTGRAFSVRYYGPSLQYEEEVSEEVFEIRNKDQGFCLQFRIVEVNALGPAIQTLFLVRETAQQGSFHAIKRMLVGDVWKQILAPAGAALIFGRSVWSENSEIRHACPRSKDWREVPVYVGLNKALQPIFLTGIQLFYLRLGFVPMNFFVPTMGQEYMALLSSATEAQIKQTISPHDWGELTKFRPESRKRWRQIVAEREACLDEDELQSRIAAKRAKQASHNR